MRVKQNFLSITNDGFVIHSSETKQFQQIHNQELKAVENKAIYINLGFVWHGVFHDVVIYNFPIMSTMRNYHKDMTKMFLRKIAESG